MQTELSGKLGIGHAVFGFTAFPAVAAAISRAGGFGVLGAVRYTAPTTSNVTSTGSTPTPGAGPTGWTWSCPRTRPRA